MSTLDTNLNKTISRNYYTNRATFQVEILTESTNIPSLFEITQKGFEIRTVDITTVSLPFSKNPSISFHQTDDLLLRIDVSKEKCILISCLNFNDRYLIYKTFQMYKFYNFQEFNFDKSFSFSGTIIGKTLEIESVSQRCLSEKTITFEISITSGLNFLPTKITKHTPTVLKIHNGSIQIISGGIVLATYPWKSILQLDFDLIQPKILKLKTKKNQIVFECSNKYLSELLYRCFKYFKSPPLRQMVKEPKPVSILTLQKSTRTLRSVKGSIRSSQQRTHLLRHTLKGIQSNLSKQNNYENFSSTSDDEDINFEEDGFQTFDSQQFLNRKSLLDKDQKTNLNMEYEIDHFHNDELRKTTPSKDAFEIAIQGKGMMSMNGYIEISGSYLKLFFPHRKFGIDKLSTNDLDSEKTIQTWEMNAFELNLSLTIFKKKRRCKTLIFEHISNSKNLNEDVDSENSDESESENENENIFKIDQNFKLYPNIFIKEKFQNHSLYAYDLKNSQHTHSTQFSILFLNYTDYKSFIKQYDQQKLRFNNNIVEGINLDSINDHLYLQIPNTVVSKQLPFTKFVFNARLIGKQHNRILLICNNNWITIFFNNGIKIYPINQCSTIVNKKNPLKLFLKIQNNPSYLIEFFELTNSALFSNIIKKSKNNKTWGYSIKGNTKPLVLNNIEDNAKGKGKGKEKEKEKENNNNLNTINCNKFGKFINCYPIDIIQESTKFIGSVLLTTKVLLLTIGYKIYCFNFTRNFTISFEKKQLNKINLLPVQSNSSSPRVQIIFNSQMEKLTFALDFLIIKQSLFPKVILKNFNQNINIFNIMSFEDNHTQKQLNKIQNKIKSFLKKEVKINKKILKKERLQKKKDQNQKTKTKKKKTQKKKKNLSINNKNSSSGKETKFNHKEDSQSNSEKELQKERSKSKSKKKSKSKHKSESESEPEYQSNNKEDSQSNSENESQQEKFKSKSETETESESETEFKSEPESDIKSEHKSGKEEKKSNSSDNDVENSSNKKDEVSDMTDQSNSSDRSLHHSSSQSNNKLSSDQSEDY
ncbi:microtubule-associated protein [Anaeramoeba flamelloides]|uniref:Microtubule-associated protein n=1 Tax=Anaeramoeba flamelloides TaxID=1746091 RepID=A0ABQ8YA46_9EUKA|nr:microtubule-associated protein [Anaeramoeba flamelloides]